MNEDESGSSGEDTSQGQDTAADHDPDPAEDPNEPMFPLPDMDYELKEADYGKSHDDDD
jgi:hypothetical protein